MTFYLSKQTIIRYLDSDDISIPSIAFTEVGSAVKRHTGSTPLANTVVAKIRDLLPSVYEIDSSLEKTATNISTSAGLRGAGSYYVAVALETDQPLVTFDTEQRKKGQLFVKVNY